MNTLELFSLPRYWEMVNAEKIALLNLLNDIKPSIAIEIGTRQGGSLQLIASLSEYVYSLDIDPEVKNLADSFKNVDFITGDSKETLPQLLNDLTSNGRQPDFILIDGDHSFNGVKFDIESVLKIRITKPLIILMHDSFNPECRKGMLEVNYESNSFVKLVEIDFVQGIYSPNERTKGEMWGGFAIIYLDPFVRTKNMLVKQSSGYSYERMYNYSKHYHLKKGTLRSNIKSYLFRKLFA